MVTDYQSAISTEISKCRHALCISAYTSKFNNSLDQHDVFVIIIAAISSPKRSAVSLGENSSMLRPYFRCHIDNRHYFYDIDNTFVFIAIAESPSKALSITLFDNLLTFSFANRADHIYVEEI